MIRKPKTLPPAEAWKILLTYLFSQHYGLELNDTPFHDSKVIEKHIEAGITPQDAINFLVERYGLIRIDRKGFSWQEQKPWLTGHDIFLARRATGCWLVGAIDEVER